MDTIGNVIYTHRHYWDCFKYNIFNCDNLPEIHYSFFDEKPEIYQTRNMYPKIDTTSFDTILNNIITGIHYNNLMILCTKIKIKLFYKLAHKQYMIVPKNNSLKWF